MLNKENQIIQYSFSIEESHKQYVKIRVDFPSSVAFNEIKIPVWRPGRYEIGNFAKNIKDFNIFNEKGRRVPFFKKNNSTWVLKESSNNSLRVEYLYYAKDLNAGSTYLDDHLLYVNPVNCCIYVDELYDFKSQIKLNIPKSWKIATGLQKKGNDLISKNFDELADSPFICSNQLQCKSYTVSDYKFNIWVNGDFKPDWSRWIKDFERFTKKQIEKFIEFPVKDYHFLIHALPYKSYHGVEHLTGTVITLGPAKEINKSLYKELLGVSSHELYHTWNVKSIRPIDMLPYDFSCENYSELGYIYEGITTYMGDLFLLKSKVFSIEQYFDELNNQLQRHFDNMGRFNYSVAESSFDTWLDGYVQGAPGRKVSIYVEGCLLAFIADVKILKATAGKYGLDEVMKRLYFNYAIKGKGITENDYRKELEQISGLSFADYFDNYIHGTYSYETLLTECFEFLGLEIKTRPSKLYIEDQVGCKVLKNKWGEFIVSSIYPTSPADMAKIQVGDVLKSIDGNSIDLECKKAFSEDLISENKLSYLRNNIEFEVELLQTNRSFYNKYFVSKMNNPIKDQEQERLFDMWKK